MSYITYNLPYINISYYSVLYHHIICTVMQKQRRHASASLVAHLLARRDPVRPTVCHCSMDAQACISIICPMRKEKLH